MSYSHIYVAADHLEMGTAHTTSKNKIDGFTFLFVYRLNKELKLGTY